MGGCISCAGLYLCECACCMACTCCQGIFRGTLAQMSRVGHLLIMVVSFSAAILIAHYYSSNKYYYFQNYLKLRLGSDCELDNDSCMYTQLIYRASLSLVVLFSLLAIISSQTNKFDNNMWLLKFVISWSLFIGFFWIDDKVFIIWSEIARIISFFWLFIQSILLLDLAHDIHDIIITNANNSNSSYNNNDKLWYTLYLIISIGSLVAALIGITFLINNYSLCSLNMFFIILTLIISVITIFISLLNCVGKGILTPSVIFAYSTFMCWYIYIYI